MLARVSLRYLVRHPWQTVLSVLGIALGVAVVVAIDLVNHSARLAFALSTEAVVGRATHQIVGGSTGLDERLYTTLRTKVGITGLAPIVEGYAQIAQEPTTTLHVLGVDVFAERAFRPYVTASPTRDNNALGRLLSEPNTALLSDDVLSRFRLDENSALHLRMPSGDETLTVVGSFRSQDKALLKAQSDIVIVDIATAQEMFGSVDRLSRIDLLVPQGEAGVAMLARIQALLPPQARIVNTGTRSQALSQMTSAFQLNLTAMSLLAIVVGMFLIYNTIAFSVVQRRSIIGVLRALGVTRGEIFRLVLLEALAIGTVGVVVGIVMGILLAQGLLHYVIRTINDLYFTLQLSAVDVDPVLLFKGAVVGIGATLLAAIVPAMEATSTQPKAVMQRSAAEEKFNKMVPYLAILGMLLMFLAGVLLVLPIKSLEIGFLTLFLVIAGFALWIPAFTQILARYSQRPFYAIFGVIGSMASRGVNASLSRTGLACTALAVAIAASVGVTVMIDSFRYSVVVWLENSLRADIYVSRADNTAQTQPSLDAALIANLSTLPGIRNVSLGRRTQLDTQLGPVELFAVKMPEASFDAFRLKKSAALAQDKFFRGDGVLISEPFAFRHNVGIGDKLLLPTDRGEQGFTIVGIYYDYSSDQGVITMYRATYERFWDDRAITSMGIYTTRGVNQADLLKKIRKLVLPTPGVVAQSNSSLRSTSIEIFDRTFAITYILRFLAVLVAFIGILSALMAIQLERAREFSVLRALGLLPAQLVALITLETGLMGLIAGLLAIPLGIMLAAILVFVINQRSFGWSMQFILDPVLLLQAVGLALLAALCAAGIPAYRIARLPPAVFLRHE